MSREKNGQNPAEPEFFPALKIKHNFSTDFILIFNNRFYSGKSKTELLGTWFDYCDFGWY